MLAILVGPGLPVRTHDPATPPLGVKPRISSEKVAGLYARQPLRFEENLGQTDGQVNFLARGLGYTVFLTRQGAVLSLGNRDSGFGSRKEESRQLSVVSRQLQKTTDHGLRTTDVVRLG